MRNLELYLKNKEIDYKKLIKYGFIKEDNKYIYRTNLYNDEFEIIVEISDKTKKSKLIDLSTNDEYILVDIEDAEGDFVGHLRCEYEKFINDIICECTNSSVFKYNQTKEIIKYIKEKYGDELEFLWEKYNSAIWRNKFNNKWYGVLLTIIKNKLNLNSDIDEIVEAINLRYQKGETHNIIDNEKIFLGYHMNKESWITIVLDGKLDTKIIKELIDNSYNLSTNKKTGKSIDEYSKKVFEYLLTIPKGKVVTYKEVAEFLGNKGLARVVGNILHKNPDGDKYPCYKVLNSKGELSKSFVFGGENEQKKRLEKEGIKVENNKVDLIKYKWNNI